MNKDILKNILIIILSVVIVLLIVLKKEVYYIYTNYDNEHICRKCVLIDKSYFCEVYGIKESD